MIESVIWLLYALFTCTMFYMGIASYREYEPGPGFWFTIIAMVLLVTGGGIFFLRRRAGKS
ncbi:MAG: LPXTG cell wall anchor domain-containing protein [Deltaproteobacteria bacterium]|nr:LPXTG cell wall anchor domain-containing protein [Deltaproteobacteria bacterium]